jgi:hypothetical protein
MSYISEWHKYLNSAQTSSQRKSMKHMLWERRENWKVDRMIFNRVLFEGRLEDVKKKYGERVPENYIDQLSKYDLSGNNKYLAHMVKLLSASGEALGTEPTAAQYSSAVRTIGRTVEQFHDLNKYISTEKGGRDIHSYKTIRDLDQAVQNAEATRQAKEAEKVHKEKIRADADRIYQDKTTLVVRPGSEEASCYYGQGTKWCISATEARNYWDSYVNEQGAVFFFILDKDAADVDKMEMSDRGKVAFVYDGDHLEANDPWDAYDETDDQLDGGEALYDYKQIWGEEKWMEIVGGIQESLDDDPPDPGIDLDEEARKLDTYAEIELGETGTADVIEFEIYGDNNEGISASVQINFEFPMGWDPEDATRSVGIEEDAVEKSYQDGINQDYMDFEYEFDHTNTSADGWPTLRIQTRMTCDDCMGGWDIGNEQRQEYRDNAESFIDNIIGEYAGQEYVEYKEELRNELVKNKVLAPERWDRAQKDIIDDIKDLDLQHFRLHINKTGGIIALLYEMVENADLGDAATPPPIGDYGKTFHGPGSRDKILFNVMRATQPAGSNRGWYSSEFDLKAGNAIKQYFVEAHEAAQRQLELPLKGVHKKPEATGKEGWQDPSMMVYLKDGPLDEKQLRGSVQVTFTKYHTGDELRATVAFIKSLDKNYDDIVQKLRDVYDEMTVEQREIEKEDEQSILDGSMAIGHITRIDNKILSEPENIRNSVVEVLKWFKENFGKMSGVEKHAAVAYLDRLEGGLTPYENVYPDDKGVPIFWTKYVKDELRTRGASHMQQQQYKWTGKRDELTEDRIQEVIKQTLIKVFKEEYKGPSRRAPPEGPLDTGKFQTRERAKHPAHKKRLIGMGKNKETGGGEGHKRPDMERSKSAPPMEEDKLID